MPRNFTSLLYTVQLMAVIIVSTLYTTFTADAGTNNAGSIAMAVVLLAFSFLVIFRSIGFVNSRERHLVLWGGMILVIVGTLLVQIFSKDTAIDRYSIVISIFIAFGINFFSNKWLESIGQKDNI